MKKRSIWVMAIVGMGLLTCGQPVKIELKQENSTPSGSIVGKIVNVDTRAPLANVDVKVPVAGGWKTTKTATDGGFVIDGLPGSVCYPIYISLSGYASSYIPSYIEETCVPGEVGIYPQGNGLTLPLIPMFEQKGSIWVHVRRTTTCGGICTAPTDVANASVDVRIDCIDLGADFGGLDACFEGFPAQVKSGTDGIAKFEGNLPGSIAGATPTIRVDAFATAESDCDGDGRKEYSWGDITDQKVYSNITRTIDVNLNQCIEQ